MTASNRRKTLALLYELLMHPEGDVRRKAGQIMGQILANSEIQSQKERPASASEMPPAMVELLEEAVSLWEHYILQCLHPDRKVAAKHAQRIANSLKVICRSLFQHCTREEAQPFLTPLLRQLWQAEGAREQFILADALCQVPLAWLPAEALPPTGRRPPPPWRRSSSPRRGPPSWPWRGCAAGYWACLWRRSTARPSPTSISAT